MGKRFAILIGAAALGAAVMAVGASANFRSVDDPRGDPECLREPGRGSRPCSDSAKRDADIVRATAGHAKAGHEGNRPRHTIRVVGKIRQAFLHINTDSDPLCEWFVSIHRGRGRPGALRPCFGNGGARTGRARYDFHHHSVEIFFRERSIGNPQSYGWSASTEAGGAHDQVPNGDGYIRHRLAQTAAKASAGVDKHNTVKIDSRVTLPPPQEKPFYGRVKSGKHACLVHRLVKVYRVTPGRDHVADQGDAKDRTDQHGKWRNRQLVLTDGNFYAKVMRRKEANFVCRPDRSPTRHVQHQG